MEMLASLEALFDRLERLERLHRGRPEPDDVFVPVRFDLAALVSELEAMSPEQRQALADGCTPPSSLPRYRIHVPPSGGTSRDIDLGEAPNSPSGSLAEKIAELQQILKVEP